MGRDREGEGDTNGRLCIWGRKYAFGSPCVDIRGKGWLNGIYTRDECYANWCSIRRGIELDTTANCINAIDSSP